MDWYHWVFFGFGCFIIYTLIAGGLYAVLKKRPDTTDDLDFGHSIGWLFVVWPILGHMLDGKPKGGQGASEV